MKLTLHLDSLSPTMRDKVLDNLKKLFRDEYYSLTADLQYYWPDALDDSPAKQDMVKWRNGAKEMLDLVSNNYS